MKERDPFQLDIDTRDIYLILLAVLAYVVIYKSIQADVYNTELIEHQHMENQHLEQLVKEKTAALEEANANLRVITETDELTGLYNRRYGMRLIDQLADMAMYGIKHRSNESEYCMSSTL